MKKTFTVDQSFILEAYNNSFSESHQQKLKESFPEAFILSPVEFAISKVGEYVLYSYRVRSVILKKGSYVLVPLPNANTDWTLAAFGYVERFVKKYPSSYPIHGVEAKMAIEALEISPNIDYLVICFW